MMPETFNLMRWTIVGMGLKMYLKVFQ